MAQTQLKRLACCALIWGWVLVLTACGNDDGDTSSSVAPSGPTPCAAYCGFMALNCTRGFVQYVNDTACMTACAGFTVASDTAVTTGDTLECRMIYAVTAEGHERKQAFCDNAGPSGGDACRP